jgi:hypothetical protein
LTQLKHGFIKQYLQIKFFPISKLRSQCKEILLMQARGGGKLCLLESYEELMYTVWDSVDIPNVKACGIDSNYCALSVKI